MVIASSFKNFLTFIGRILFSIIFITAGIRKIIDFNETVAYLGSMNLPYPEILTIMAIILELGGALMILLGWHAKIGALLILIFTLTVSFVIHHFWTYPLPEMQVQMQNFLKNLAIMGGALYIICFGPGAYSLDSFRLARKTNF